MEKAFIFAIEFTKEMILNGLADAKYIFGLNNVMQKQFNLTYDQAEILIENAVNFNSTRKLKYFERAKWRAKLETAGGGVLLSFGSHILDVIIYLFGEPSSVIGKIDNLKFKNIEVEDTAFGIIKFQNEIYVQNNCSLITNLKNKEFIESVELNIFGEVGNCYYRGPWPVSSLKWQTTNQFDDKNNNLKESDYSLCFNAFCNWIIYDEPFLNTVEESSKVLMLIKALYKSSKTGKEERIHSLI